MRRLSLALAAVAAVLAAGWSGLWVYFRGAVADVLDSEEAKLVEAGGRIAYAGRDIEGFPTAFRVAYRGLLATLPDGTAVEVPSVAGEVSAFEAGVMRLSLPPAMTLTLPSAPAPLKLSVTTEAMVLESRATPEGGTLHRLTADSVALSRIEGGRLAALTATAEDLSARIAVDPGDPAARVEATAALASFGWRAEIEGQGATDIRISLVDAALSTATDRRAGPDILRHIADGRALRASLTADNLALDGTAPTARGPVALKAAGRLRSASLALDDGAGRAEVDLAGLDGSLDLSGTGKAMAVGATEVAMVLGLPLRAAEAPGPLAAALRLDALTLDEVLWRVLDPAEALPRDPVNLTLDLAGTGRWAIDPVTLTRTPAPPGIRPFDIPELTLKTLSLAALGARVDGTGSATLPETARVAEGRLDLTAAGLRALVGHLEAAGLIGAGERILANGFLATYAVPGPEPDSFATEVRFGEDGLLVNGKPIRAAAPVPVDAPLPPVPEERAIPDMQGPATRAPEAPAERPAQP